MKKRSIGLIIFGILYIVVGILFLLVTPLFSILYLIVGVGVLMLKTSARTLAIITSILGIIASTASVIILFQKHPEELSKERIITGILLTYLFHSGEIYFFTRPQVKEQFQQ